MDIELKTMETEKTYKKVVNKSVPLYTEDGIAVGYASKTETGERAKGTWFRLYKDALEILRQCNKPEYDLFLSICSRINYVNGNTVELNLNVKIEIRKELNMSTQAFDRNLRSLQHKDLIKKWEGSTFLVNPEISFFGSGTRRLEAYITYISIAENK